MMSKKNVPVILLPEEGGGYSVFVPLFPSCTTQGETAEEALKNAKEALELLLEEPTEDDLECLDILDISHIVVGHVEVEAPNARPDKVAKRFPNQ
jgi:predicted RNase H-like HicB family nuclease